jgi:hypothetical protein
VFANLEQTVATCQYALSEEDKPELAFRCGTILATLTLDAKKMCRVLAFMEKRATRSLDVVVQTGAP